MPRACIACGIFSKPVVSAFRFCVLLNPNRLINHNVSKVLVFMLFPNIFYFLVGILYVFATYAAATPASQRETICSTISKTSLGSNERLGFNS